LVKGFEYLHFRTVEKFDDAGLITLTRGVIQRQKQRGADLSHDRDRSWRWSLSYITLKLEHGAALTP